MKINLKIQSKPFQFNPMKFSGMKCYQDSALQLIFIYLTSEPYIGMKHPSLLTNKASRNEFIHREHLVRLNGCHVFMLLYNKDGTYILMCIPPPSLSLSLSLSLSRNFQDVQHGKRLVN